MNKLKHIAVLDDLIDWVEFHYPACSTKEEFVDKLHAELKRRIKELNNDLAKDTVV